MARGHGQGGVFASRTRLEAGLEQINFSGGQL